MQHVKTFAWAMVASLAATVIAVAAGQRPLPALILATAVFLTAAIALELWPRLDMTARVRRGAGALARRSPLVVSRRETAIPAEPRPRGERGLLDFRRDGDRALAEMVVVLTAMAKD